MRRLPPESARNCIQELYPIPNGEIKKSINGDMLFLETTERKKYRSVISCKDVNMPVIDGIWIGSQLNIGCIQNLWQVINPGRKSVKLIRPAVNNSVCAIDKFGNPVKFSLDDNEVILPKTHDEKVFICFRPWLTMHVIDFAMETNEWGMSGSWKLITEEV